MALTFDLTPPARTPNGTVAFKGMYSGQIVQCEISDEALLDNCGAGGIDANSLLGAFIANRATIEAKAASKLPSRIANGERALLRSLDF